MAEESVKYTVLEHRSIEIINVKNKEKMLKNVYNYL